MRFINILAKKIIKEVNLLLPVLASSAEIEKVYNFFINYNDFRLLETCAFETGLSIYKCARIKKYLYRTRKLGLYFFAANTPPQKYMRDYILKKLPTLKNEAFILEVGPGEAPIFDYQDFPNWQGIDKFFTGETIEFKRKGWAKNKYPVGKICQGSFENLSESLASSLGKYDLLVSSHAYEHTLQPIQALRESAKMLKAGGLLVLFVPDGFSDDINAKDPTHTLYLNPKMIEEFLAAAGGWRDIQIEVFRPNADLVIRAIKI